MQTLSYDTSEQSWLIKGLGIEQLFTPEDIFTPETPFPTVEEQYLVMVNNQPVASMNILAPEPGGMALEYARNLTYAIRNEFQGNNFENGNCVFGVPTLPDDQPNATSVTYADYATIGSIIYVYDDGTFAAYRISGSEEAISVNLNTFAVDISMHLIGTLDDNSTSGAGSAAEATLDLGTFTANGIQIDDEPYGIGGYFDAPNPSAEMPFQGWFFGPQGKEIAFSYSKQMADGYRSFGAVNLVARR
ncbi:hypothetical protein AB433_12825 [Croceicoccus naphthovorans]|uniref:Transferrin-binding protein B C-lobe/N-lobe beta barrel domain-containing protein n=1 Tax=Croceicoccus naphthovorans TaxID=1348774 RepID=A0A0G3XJV6_9SPHN|nr:hypothetical protein AB433_12825 [Croceicoccus naphthovorans]